MNRWWMGFGLLVLSYGCAFSRMGPTQAASTRLPGMEQPVIGGDVTGAWTVDRIVDTPVIAGTTVSLEFRDGRLTGSGSCNRFNASYTDEDGRLTIGMAAATRKACEATLMEQEQRFFQALSRVSAQRVRDGTRLELLADDRTTVVISAHR